MFSDSMASAIVGAVAGAIVAITVYFGQRRQTRWSVVMAMINEFNSPAMIAARSNAHRFLIGKFDLKYDVLEDRFLDPESVRAKNDLWLIVSFYERLSIFVKGGVIDTSMAGKIFGEIFFWWWGFSFADQLPDEWSASGHARWLHHWMGRHFANHDNPRLIAYWTAKGLGARSRIAAPEPAA